MDCVRPRELETDILQAEEDKYATGKPVHPPPHRCGDFIDIGVVRHSGNAHRVSEPAAANDRYKA